MAVKHAPMRYTFVEVTACNMCGSPVQDHKILGKRLNKSQGRKPHKKTGITTSVCKCTKCGLIFSNPQPVPYDLQDHYGVSPESYWTENYFKIDDHYFAGEIQQLNKLMPFKEGHKSLDIGAGIGKQMIALERAGYDAYGFEPSRPFYKRAVSTMHIRPDHIQCSSIETAQYPANEFDFISFGAVLEHLYNPAQSIETALGWLKPGGLIHIEVPSSRWLINRLYNTLLKLKGKDYVANISPMHEPYHLYEFGLDSFRLHAQKTGYDIAHHEFMVCTTYAPKWADWVLKPYMKRTKTGMQLVVWLRKK